LLREFTELQESKPAPAHAQAVSDPDKQQQHRGGWQAQEQVSGDSGSGSSYLRVLELGCGCGNSIFPLLEKLDNLYCIGVDFSETAIALLKQHPAYLARDRRCEAYVSDVVTELANGELQRKTGIVDGSIDVILLIFVLSAIAPEHYDGIFTSLRRLLAPGGRILFRDYGYGDAAQARFVQAGNKSLDGDAFFVRHDGTRAYFFTTSLIADLAARHQLTLLENHYVTRQIENKKLSTIMDRCWIQSKLQLPHSSSSSQ
jgi:methyltransferase-like protein 6